MKMSQHFLLLCMMLSMVVEPLMALPSDCMPSSGDNSHMQMSGHVSEVSNFLSQDASADCCQEQSCSMDSCAASAFHGLPSSALSLPIAHGHDLIIISPQDIHRISDPFYRPPIFFV